MSTEKSITLYIESPTGERFEVSATEDLKLGQVAADFFEASDWPTTAPSGRAQRAVIELVDPENPYRTKRLREEQTIREAALWEGATLRIYPEAVAACFLGGVKISLADGEKKQIKELSVGDVLLSGEPLSKSLTTARVIKVFKSTSPRYLTLNGVLHVTESHPVWSDGKWVTAGELAVGDHLQTVSGDVVDIKTIERRHEDVEVFNLYVSSEEHTFFAEDILVHNAARKFHAFAAGDPPANPFPHTLAAETLPGNLLRIRIPLPSLLTAGEFFDNVTERVRAVEFIYSVFALVQSGDPDVLEDFVAMLRQRNDSPSVSDAMLRSFLIAADVEPLRLAAVHYGSPASFDFLGFGKVIEVLRETLKDLIYRVKYEKEKADLELKSKLIEIENAKLETEKKSIELTAQRLDVDKAVLTLAFQKIELLEKASSLKLADDDIRLITSALLAKMLTISDNPITPVFGREETPRDI